MIVSELIEKLKTLPQDKSIICQVVFSNGGAWNMHFDFQDVPSSWMVQLSVFHPNLKDRPPVVF